MTLDPKKLEAARMRFGSTDEVLRTCGVPDLEARAARADDLEHEREADAEKMRLYSREAAARQDESHSLNILCDELREEIAALKAELARFEWRPIEEAPKDGTKVDIFIPALGERYPEAYFDPASKAFCWDIDGTGQRVVFDATPPTHFMPLPTPPQAKEADHEA